MNRFFRTIQLGHRRVMDVQIPSGVRVEELRGGKWEQHSVQPDLESALSLLRSVSVADEYVLVSRGISENEPRNQHFKFYKINE